MSSFFAPRHAEFADTLMLAAPAGGRATDPLAELLAAQHADWAMLRLVACSALATLLLGVAGSLVA